jgi:hypothetical protein
MFPLNVETAAGLLKTVRVFGCDEFTEVWGLVAGQPAVIETGAGFVKQGRSQGETFGDGTKAKWTLLLADGTVWLATPSSGCGCGNKLKSFNPERAVRA